MNRAVLVFKDIDGSFICSSHFSGCENHASRLKGGQQLGIGWWSKFGVRAFVQVSLILNIPCLLAEEGPLFAGSHFESHCLRFPSQRAPAQAIESTFSLPCAESKWDWHVDAEEPLLLHVVKEALEHRFRVTIFAALRAAVPISRMGLLLARWLHRGVAVLDTHSLCCAPFKFSLVDVVVVDLR